MERLKGYDLFTKLFCLFAIVGLMTINVLSGLVALISFALIREYMYAPSHPLISCGK